MRRKDLSGGDVEHGEEPGCAVPLVIVTLAANCPSVRQLQICLRTLQRLDRGLLVDTQDDRLGRRIDMEADHVGRRGALPLNPLRHG